MTDPVAEAFEVVRAERENDKLLAAVLRRLIEEAGFRTSLIELGSVRFDVSGTIKVSREEYAALVRAGGRSHRQQLIGSTVETP